MLNENFSVTCTCTSQPMMSRPHNNWPYMYIYMVPWWYGHPVAQMLWVASLSPSSIAWLETVDYVGPPVSVVEDPLHTCMSAYWLSCFNYYSFILSWLLYSFLVVLYPSRLNFAEVEYVQVQSKISCYRKRLFKVFHTHCFVWKFFVRKVIHLYDCFWTRKYPKLQ